MASPQALAEPTPSEEGADARGAIPEPITLSFWAFGAFFVSVSDGEITKNPRQERATRVQLGTPHRHSHLGQPTFTVDPLTAMHRAAFPSIDRQMKDECIVNRPV